MTFDYNGYAFVDCETDHLPPSHMPWEIAVIWKGSDVDAWMEEVIQITDFDEAMVTEQAAAVNGFHERWLALGHPDVRHMSTDDAVEHLERVLAGNARAARDAFVHIVESAR